MLDEMSLVNNEMVRGCLCSVFQNDIDAFVFAKSTSVVLFALFFNVLSGFYMPLSRVW